MDSNELFELLKRSKVISADIYYVGEFSFPVFRFIHADTHMLCGEMTVNHEGFDGIVAKVRTEIVVPTVTIRGFDTREEFEIFAQTKEVLMDYVFDWDALERRYGVYVEDMET